MKLTGSKSEKKYLPMRRGEDDFTIVRADTNKLVELTGFKPTYSLREGLERTIAWYKDNLDNL
jgi:nucleoside-diphosphate-sugar epimerase